MDAWKYLQASRQCQVYPVRFKARLPKGMLPFRRRIKTYETCAIRLVVACGYVFVRLLSPELKHASKAHRGQLEITQPKQGTPYKRYDALDKTLTRITWKKT